MERSHPKRRRREHPSIRSGRHPGPPGRWPRLRQWLHRARSDGHERHTLLLVGKSTLAATAAWAIAYSLLDAEAPAFAPFSAVLMMQVTLYQSMAQALRYLAAVAAGVALQGVIGFVAGSDLVTFALVALIALAIGRWPRLGAQGTQVATAAFFAFSTYIAASSTLERATELGQILVLVGIGCTVGVTVNLLVIPPMRFRSAEYGVRALAHSMCELLSDIHPVLREGELEPERTRRWADRASRLGAMVAQARSALDTGEESVRYNPLRLLRRHRKRSFAGYFELVNALERVTYQLASVTRTLDLAVEAPDQGPSDQEFLTLYADFLASLSEITEQLGAVDEDRLASQSKELCSLAEQAAGYADRLSDGSWDIDVFRTEPESPYGTLLIEAARLQQEFQHTCDLLQRVADRRDSSRSTRM